jgi:hypothetical protein
MALLPCPECQREVSDKAPACPQCGFPLRRTPFTARLKMALGGVLVVALAGGAVALARRFSDYSRVEQLRAEQDKEGTHSEHVKQRFFRLFKAHPKNAMYIYLWARCVDDPVEQLELAQEGIHEDPAFSWNYNMASRAMARVGRIAEAYDQAVKGAALDPGNIQLVEKQRSLKLMLDHKLEAQAKPAPNAYTTYDSKENFEKGAVRYQGLFRSVIKQADRADSDAMGKARAPDYKAPVGDVVRGIVVCANPYADVCMRVYVPRDDRFKTAWPHPAANVDKIKEHQLVTVAGAVVTNSRGENILLADSITVEAP